jgi:glucokinase
MILAGDVGGTKTILALFGTAGDGFQALKKQQYASADYATFTQLLKEFISDTGCTHLKSACIGVAGPIIDGHCETTNLPWTLNKETIANQLGTQQAWLLNDLEAAACGLLALPGHYFVELNPSAGQQQGNKAVLAAGTGLGEAIMAWDGKNYHVIATEGGHADFAPTNKQEMALLDFLLEKYPGHVSYERLVSGEGLTNIYQFLKTIEFAPVNSQTEQQMRERDPAAVISEAGIMGNDPLCLEALTIFCRIYGAESGNLALKSLPYGGIYLAGGIAPKILPFLKKGDYLGGFLAKGRYRDMLQKISVKVCTNPEVALLGALDFAVKRAA